MDANNARPPIRKEKRGQTLWIWIDREERRNAINKEVVSGIESAVADAQADASIQSIVLTGAGRKAFCAGADLTGGAQTFTLGLDQPMTDFGRLARVMRDLGVPVIGRINGDCVAGGMGLMSLCDLVVVADHARFGLPEAKVGVFPMQVLVFLRSMIGARHINELCLTGELIDAARAREIGIANYVVPFEELDSRVETLIARLAEMSPVALKRDRRDGANGISRSTGLCGDVDFGHGAHARRDRGTSRVQRASKAALDVGDLRCLRNEYGSAVPPARGAIAQGRLINYSAPVSTIS
jgi:methylglutaconyl-CoA hydratase